MSIRSKIVSTGSYVPENVVANDELTNFPKISIPLIEQKTGVKVRRFAEENQSTSDLAFLAAKSCLEKAPIKPCEIEAIILATSSPDRIQPATATRVQHLIGAINAFAFDINSVCSGGIFALYGADSMIRAGFCKNVLVVGAEIYSRYLNPKDFSTYPYFGDGAGAVLLSAASGMDSGIIHSILHSDGSGADTIQVPGGGTMLPGYRIKNHNDFYFRMYGKQVYEFAINKGVEVVNEILTVTGIRKEQIKFIIPHQANINIIKELSARLDFDYDKFVVNVDKYGNTAAASTLIGLDELIKSKKAASNDLIMLVVFGGGLSWGTTLIRL